MRRDVIRVRTRKLLEMYPYLEARAYKNADTNAVNTLVDVNSAIDRAELDNMDKFILHKVFFEDKTQFQIEEEYNLTRSIIRYRTDRVLSKVGKEYYRPISKLRREMYGR